MKTKKIRILEDLKSRDGFLFVEKDTILEVYDNGENNPYYVVADEEICPLTMIWNDEAEEIIE